LTRACGAGAPHPPRDDGLVQLSLTTRAGRPHKASSLVTAVLLFASVCVLRLAITEPEAALGTARLVLWASGRGRGSGVAGYVARVVALVLIGALVGIYAVRHAPGSGVGGRGSTRGG
jgi:hypothetical protein